MNLIEKIKSRSAVVGVIGMGYVGLPLTLTLAANRFRVIGVDINEEKIHALKLGELTFAQKEPGLQVLLDRVRRSYSCEFTCEYQRLRSVDVVIITVQTPLQLTSLVPDYRVLWSAIKSVATVISKYSLLVVQSTIAPQTSRDEIYPTIEKLSRYKVGKDLFYAHVPERVMPGMMLASLRDLPRIIGANDKISRDAAWSLYEPITSGIIDLTDIITAEVAKTAENSHRFMEIQFANALALTCEQYGVSYQTIRRLANERNNVHLLQPGAGVGGHCIPKDPWLLVRNHRGSNLYRLFKEGVLINKFMADHTIELVKIGLKKAGVNFRKAHIAVLGISYREGSDDIRSSPANIVISSLTKMGAKLTVHDSEIPEYYNKDLAQVIKNKHAVVVLTAHAEYRKFPLEKIKKLLKYPLIIDGRQTWDRREAIKLGFTYLQIGEPHE